MLLLVPSFFAHSSFLIYEEMHPFSKSKNEFPQPRTLLPRNMSVDSKFVRVRTERSLWKRTAKKEHCSSNWITSFG